jgi:hypothetical protein
VLCVAVCVALGGSDVAGQSQAAGATRPNFAGRWAVEEPAAPGGPGAQAGRGAPGGGRGDMGSGWGTPLAITQDDQRLVVEYAFFARGDMQPPLRFTYALDGSETRNAVTMGRGSQAQLSRVSWDGEKLVISTRHSFADPSTGKLETMEVKQILSLDSPTALTVETVRGAVLGGQPTSTKTAYKKL